MLCGTDKSRRPPTLKMWTFGAVNRSCGRTVPQCTHAVTCHIRPQLIQPPTHPVPVPKGAHRTNWFGKASSFRFFTRPPPTPPPPSTSITRMDPRRDPQNESTRIAGTVSHNAFVQTCKWWYVIFTLHTIYHHYLPLSNLIDTRSIVISAVMTLDRYTVHVALF